MNSRHTRCQTRVCRQRPDKSPQCTWHRGYMWKHQTSLRKHQGGRKRRLCLNSLYRALIDRFPPGRICRSYTTLRLSSRNRTGPQRKRRTRYLQLVCSRTKQRSLGYIANRRCRLPHSPSWKNSHQRCMVYKPYSNWWCKLS